MISGQDKERVVLEERSVREKGNTFELSGTQDSEDVELLGRHPEIHVASVVRKTFFFLSFFFSSLRRETTRCVMTDPPSLSPVSNTEQCWS